ncbi:hypothetical protein Bhyg_11862, partial [Pseudolycoriella hygida]
MKKDLDRLSNDLHGAVQNVENLPSLRKHKYFTRDGICHIALCLDDKPTPIFTLDSFNQLVGNGASSNSLKRTRRGGGGNKAKLAKTDKGIKDPKEIVDCLSDLDQAALKPMLWSDVEHETGDNATITTNYCEKVTVTELKIRCKLWDNQMERTVPKWHPGKAVLIRYHPRKFKPIEYLDSSDEEVVQTNNSKPNLHSTEKGSDRNQPTNQIVESHPIVPSKQKKIKSELNPRKFKPIEYLDSSDEEVVQTNNSKPNLHSTEKGSDRNQPTNQIVEIHPINETSGKKNKIHMDLMQDDGIDDLIANQYFLQMPSIIVERIKCHINDMKKFLYYERRIALLKRAMALGIPLQTCTPPTKVAKKSEPEPDTAGSAPKRGHERPPKGGKKKSTPYVKKGGTKGCGRPPKKSDS